VDVNDPLREGHHGGEKSRPTAGAAKMHKKWAIHPNIHRPSTLLAVAQIDPGKKAIPKTVVTAKTTNSSDRGDI